MGFCIGAIAPKPRSKPVLEYNAAGWHALWPYVAERCSDILTPSDQEAGMYNDGLVVSAKKAAAIYERLRADLKSLPPFHPEYGFARGELKQLARFIGGSGGFEIW